jgi:hypothetical protein
MRRKPSHTPTGRLQSLRLFSTLLAISLICLFPEGDLSEMAWFRHLENRCLTVRSQGVFFRNATCSGTAPSLKPKLGACIVTAGR